MELRIFVDVTFFVSSGHWRRPSDPRAGDGRAGCAVDDTGDVPEEPNKPEGRPTPQIGGKRHPSHEDEGRGHVAADEAAEGWGEEQGAEATERPDGPRRTSLPWTWPRGR